jgi:hypothetical protein
VISYWIFIRDWDDLLHKPHSQLDSRQSRTSIAFIYTAMHLHPSIPAGSAVPPVLPLNTVDSSWNAAAVAWDCYEPHWKLHPLVYTAQRAPNYLRDMINGDVFKPEWDSVPWSDAFGDIQGETMDAAATDSTIATEKVDTHTSAAAAAVSMDQQQQQQRRTGSTAVIHEETKSTKRNTLVGETRFKALYDDDYLYIAALLHPPDAFDLPTVATFTKRNSPIYQVDSDFEVFIDVFGTNFDYKELEVNALNTVWNLCLDKPYDNGGCEHSGRVANSTKDAHYYEVSNQISATRVVRGRLNDNATGQGATWSVEVAWSRSDLAQTVNRGGDDDNNSAQQQQLPPAVWRINFSRVERQGRINWTWQPQVKWDASQRRYRGFVNMHLPDAWGYLVWNTTTNGNGSGDSAVEQPPPPPSWRDAHWPAKLTALTVYYALHEYCAQYGTFTNVLADLAVPRAIVEPFDIDIDVDVVPPPEPPPTSNDVSLYFLVTARSKVDGTAVSVRHDRFLTLLECSHPSATACADSSNVA